MATAPQRSIYTNDLIGAQTYNTQVQRYNQTNPGSQLQLDDEKKYTSPGTVSTGTGGYNVNTNIGAQGNTVPYQQATNYASTAGQTPGIGSSPAPQGQILPGTPSAPTNNLTPWIKNNTFDATYGKGIAEQDYKSAVDYFRNDYTDPYAQQKLAQITANYNGLSTSANGLNFNPTNAQDEASLQNAVNKENMTYLDQQIQAATAKARDATQGNIAGVNATIGAVNREGVQSAGNPIAAVRTGNQFQADFNSYQAQLSNQMRQLQEAQASGNTELAGKISKQIESTQAVMQQHLAQQVDLVKGMAQAGAFNGMSPDQVAAIGSAFNALPIAAIQAIAKTQNTAISNTQSAQQLQNYKAGLGVAQDYFINNGQPIDYQTASQLSKQTGLPADSIMNLNARAVQISQDNTLTQEQKQAQLTMLQTEANNELNGVFTNEAKNWQLYFKMKNSGASEGDLQDLAGSLGLNVANNPAFQLEQQYKEAQIQKNYGDMANADANYYQMTGSHIPGSQFGQQWIIPQNSTMRTDRNNNPIASKMYSSSVRLLEQAGLQPGVDFTTTGDSTAGVDSDSVGTISYTSPEAGIKGSIALLAGGQMASWYANSKYGGANQIRQSLSEMSGQQVNSAQQAQNVFNNLSQEQQVQIVGDIYKHEGGRGQFNTGNQQGSRVPGTTGSSQIDATVDGYNSTIIPGTGGLTQSALDRAALNYAMTGQMPPGGRSSSGAGLAKANAIQNRAAELDPAGNLAVHKSEFESLSKSLNEQTQYYNDVSRAVNNADKGFQQILNTFQSKGINDHDMPIANAISNASKYNLGSGDVSAFKAALAEVQNEYQQVFARGGQVSDKVRELANGILDGDISLNNLKAVHDELQAQGKIVVDGAKGQMQSIQNDMNNILNPNGTQQNIQDTSSGSKAFSFFDPSTWHSGVAAILNQHGVTPQPQDQVSTLLSKWGIQAQ